MPFIACGPVPSPAFLLGTVPMLDLFEELAEFAWHPDSRNHRLAFRSRLVPLPRLPRRGGSVECGSVFSHRANFGISIVTRSRSRCVRIVAARIAIFAARSRLAFPAARYLSPCVLVVVFTVMFLS